MASTANYQFGDDSPLLMISFESGENGNISKNVAELTFKKYEAFELAKNALQKAEVKFEVGDIQELAELNGISRSEVLRRNMVPFIKIYKPDMPDLARLLHNNQLISRQEMYIIQRDFIERTR